MHALSWNSERLNATIIALLPILTSTGRGADIMIPMAIPVFGGMVVASITYFIVLKSVNHANINKGEDSLSWVKLIRVFSIRDFSSAILLLTVP